MPGGLATLLIIIVGVCAFLTGVSEKNDAVKTFASLIVVEFFLVAWVIGSFATAHKKIESQKIYPVQVLKHEDGGLVSTILVGNETHNLCKIFEYYVTEDKVIQHTVLSGWSLGIDWEVEVKYEVFDKKE